MPALSPRLPSVCLASVVGLALAAGAASAVTVEVRIATSSNDAEQMNTGAVTADSSDLELVVDGSDVQLVGLRFPGMAIPQGAFIEQAWVQFQVDEVSTAAASLTIQGETTPQAPTFAETSNNVSLRPRTAASVAWVPAAWSTVGEQGPNQRTPNLAPVIQELVSAGTWASGNPIVLIVTGSGRRTAEAFDGAPAGAPLLHVEYGFSGNFSPSVSISTPANNGAFDEGAPIAFAGSASDPEDGDLSAAITWTSSLDGVIGVGASFSRDDLSLGLHQLTAGVVDSESAPAQSVRQFSVFAATNQVLAAGNVGNCGDATTRPRARCSARCRAHPRPRRPRLSRGQRRRTSRTASTRPGACTRRASTRSRATTSGTRRARSPTSTTSAPRRGRPARAGTASTSATGTWSACRGTATSSRAAAARARRRASGSRPTSRRTRSRARWCSRTSPASARSSAWTTRSSSSGRSTTSTAWTWC